jgi:hypothetical protein
MIQHIKNIFKTHYGVTASVRRVKSISNSENMNKILFVEVIRILKNISMDSEYLREEIGIDLSGIEEQYNLAISNLLRMNFSDTQIQLINYYVYDMPEEGEFEGKMEVTERKKVQTYTFKTAEDLWDVLKVVK